MPLNKPESGHCNTLHQPDKRDADWSLYCELPAGHEGREHWATDPRTGAHVHWRR